MKCDTPILTPGGVTVGCTLEVTGSPTDPHPGLEHDYVKEGAEFTGKVILCPVCSTTVGDTSEAQFECPTCDTLFALGGAIESTEGPTPTSTQPFDGAILLCPTCQSTADAEGWGPQTITCDVDNTQFTVALMPEAVFEHSMY